MKSFTPGSRAYALKPLDGRPPRRLVKRIIWTLLFVSTAGPIVLILFFPGAALVLVNLENLPVGISDRHQLERNFWKKRLVLEDVVAALRADNLTTARRGYWGLLGYTRPEPRGVEYRQLYRSMRQARIQRVEITSREPFRVQLVTDEEIFTIVTDVYGYVYTDDNSSDAQDFFGSRNRLDQNWYQFEGEIYVHNSIEIAGCLSC